MKPDNLITHPEGGRFKEVFRSTVEITTSSGARRSALTHIYFSLKKGEVSRFHKVASDEVWNLYQGGSIRLYLWDEAQATLSSVELSAQKRTFCHVVPAGIWQAAEPLCEEVLVGCSVGPGFEFEDFELIDEGSDAAASILNSSPELERFI